MAPQITCKKIYAVTPRMDFREILKDCFKKLNIEDLQFFSQLADVPEGFNKQSSFLLILDVEESGESLGELLSKLKQNNKLESFPIFLLTKQLDDKIVAFGKEIMASKIHTGPIYRDAIFSLLKEILIYERDLSSVRATLFAVETMRSDEDFAGVESELTRAFAQDEENRRLRVELADCKISLGKWEEALELLSPLELLEPPYIRAFNLLARVLMKLSQYDRAIDVLKKAKILNPFQVDRLIDLGQSLLQLDLIDQAKEEFAQAQKLEPKNALAKQGTGQCLLLQGEVNEGLELLREVANRREMASIFNLTAVIAMKHGRFEKGMILYNTAIGAVGANPDLKSMLMFNKGLGFRRWTKDAEALKCFKQAVDLNPTYERAKASCELVSKKLGVELDKKYATSSPSSTTVQDFAYEPIGGDEETTKNTDFALDMDDDFDDEKI